VARLSSASACLEEGLSIGILSAATNSRVIYDGVVQQGKNRKNGKKAKPRPAGRRPRGGRLPKGVARAGTAASIPEVIEHPDLLSWWGISILVSILIVLLVRRQAWMRPMLLGFSAVFFALISFYVLSFVVSERPRDVNFINEVGWGYFVQLFVIGYLPWGAIRRLGKAPKPAYAPPPHPAGEFERAGS